MPTSDAIHSLETVKECLQRTRQEKVRANILSFATAKQTLAMRGLVSENTEDDYRDFLAYPHIEKSKLCKLDLEKWECLHILAHYENLETEFKRLVENNIFYFLDRADM